MVDLDRRTVIGGIAAAAAAAPIQRAFAEDSGVNFLVIGDWGRRGNPRQRRVAKGMGIAAKRLASRFVVSTGDNFYNGGVTKLDDTHWRDSFESVYTDPSLQIPWYVALGNHDYCGDPEIQVKYTEQSTRWKMPHRYYKVSPTANIDLFILDTPPIVGENSGKLDHQFACNIESQCVQLQLDWLDRELAASHAAWKFVIGHHTIRSSGSHGDNKHLAELINPRLTASGIQVYINGHDHDLEHIRRDGIDYICSGAGSDLRDIGHPVQGSLFAEKKSGFASLTVYQEFAKLAFLNEYGEPIVHKLGAPYEALIPRVRSGQIAGTQY